MPSTRKSLTKSGNGKAGTLTKCAPTKSSGTLTPNSSPDSPTKPADALHQVVCWFLEGNSEHDLKEAIAQFFPDLKAEDLFAGVVQHFEKAGEADGTTIRGFCIEAYRELYRRALEIGDFTTALKSLARLEQTAAK